MLHELQNISKTAVFAASGDTSSLDISRSVFLTWWRLGGFLTSKVFFGYMTHIRPDVGCRSNINKHFKTSNIRRWFVTRFVVAEIVQFFLKSLYIGTVLDLTK